MPTHQCFQPFNSELLIHHSYPELSDREMDTIHDGAIIATGFDKPYCDPASFVYYTGNGAIGSLFIAEG